jgi:MoaA/NifB/PqqE/SkfB family radical SAM enzyme
MAEDGLPFSVYRQSLEEIWNSETMRSMRRDMLAGQWVKGCDFCYQQEAVGCVSVRQEANAAWRDRERIPLDIFRSQDVAADFRPSPPDYLQLTVGTQCNLKCRMCNGGASSRINLDPVHRRWAGVEDDAIANGQRWWQQDRFIRNLFPNPDRLRTLNLIGGEPLIVKEVGALLQYLINAGVASQVLLEVATNATTAHAPWLELTRHFREVILHPSIDGFGTTYEYIRYPARWEKLVGNLEKLRQLPKTSLSANVTVQAYNALEIVDLFRFLDKVRVPFGAYATPYPDHLTIRVLPPRLRRLAAVRLRAYAERDCLDKHREMVRALALGLEALEGHWDQSLFHEFMVFTNDLDASRGQSVRTSLPELWELIAGLGIEWTTQTRHFQARRDTRENAECADIRVGTIE